MDSSKQTRQQQERAAEPQSSCPQCRTDRVLEVYRRYNEKVMFCGACEHSWSERAEESRRSSRGR